MSFNLVDLIKNELGDVVIDQVTNLLGESKENTGKAVNAVVSGILESLVSSSSKEGGATNFSDTLASMDDGLLGNFSSMLSSNKSSSLIETGTKLLVSLMGDGAISKIATTIAGFSGIKSKSATSLIGLLAPVILGVIRKKMSSDNLDSNALLSMLHEQKDNIAQATPTDMKSNTTTGTEAHQTPKIEANPTSGFRKIFLWLPLILLLCLLAYFLPKLTSKNGLLDTGSVTDTIEDLENPVSDISTETPDYVNIGSDLGSIVNKITDSLSSVTDAESATAALPQLTEATSKIGTLSEVFSKLPDPAKSTISSLAENKISALQPMIDRLVEIPGVGSILKPAIDSLMQKLALFSAT